MFIGTWYSGFVAAKYATSSINATTKVETIAHDWHTIWLYPAAIAGAVLIAFIFTFKEKKEIAAA